MKKLDLTKTGGFPFDQDQLDWCLSGATESLISLGKLGNNTAPIIVSGMVSDGTTVTDGMLYWNNDYIPFTGGAIGATIAISTYNTVIVYSNGHSFSSKSRTAAAFGTGAVQFNYADLRLFQQGFGLKARDAWKSFTGASGLSGSYKFDRLTNIVHLRGAFTQSQSILTFPSEAPQSIGMLVLPTEIWPSSTIYRAAFIEKHAVPVIFDSNGAPFTMETMRITSDGTLSHFAHKLASGVTAPTMFFDFSYFK